MSTALVTSNSYAAFNFAAHQRINRKKSGHTRTAYRRDFNRWVSFCEYLEIDPSVASADHAASFRDHLQASLANNSTRRALSSLSWLYRVLFHDHEVKLNPFHPALIAWPEQDKTPKTALVSDAVARAMIAHAGADDDPITGMRDAAILQVLYDTGFRRESVATLLRVGYQPPAIHAVLKGGREFDVELPVASIAAIDRWLEVAEESPYLFPGRVGHVGLSTINDLVRTRATAVGAPHVHPHCFRAAWVTAGYDAQLPEYEIQGGAGHKDATMTKRYDRGARGVTAAVKIAEHRGRGRA